MSSSPKWQFLDRLREKNPTLYFFTDLFINIVVVVALVFSVRTFLISPFQVYGPSMCNTLNYLNSVCQDGFGEYLIVNKAVYYPFLGKRYREPQRGDVIVFRPPQEQKDFYIKRIIGLPGEKVKLENGKVYVYNKEHQSGFPLPEAYLSEENQGKTWPIPSHLVETYEVPEGQYFVMGDNRRKSTDSRSCFRGSSDRSCTEEKNNFLKVEAIEGRAWVVLWPFHKARVLKAPEYETL